MPGGRHKSREILFRVLFETDLSGEDAREALEEALGRYRLTEEGRDHALLLVRTYMARRAEIDALLRDALQNWTLERTSGVVRAILRLALAELQGAADVPTEVALDEAIRLARRYGEAESPGFVNGVLDPLARRLRPGSLGDTRPVPQGRSLGAHEI